MTLTEQFLEELNREAPRTRRVLDNIPQGHDDWKPHDKSMPLARLAGLVATMPSWVNLIVDQDELDLTPPGGGTFRGAFGRRARGQSTTRSWPRRRRACRRRTTSTC